MYLVFVRLVETMGGMMIATGLQSTATFELPLTLTGGLSAEEADRSVAVAMRAGDIGAGALSFYPADLLTVRGTVEGGCGSWTPRATHWTGSLRLPGRRSAG